MSGAVNTNKLTTPEEHLYRAQYLDEHEHRDEAIVVLREMTRRWPGRPDGWSQLSAMIYLTGDHLIDALAAAHRALALNPNDVCALAHGGHAAYQLGNLALAKTLYERLVVVEPVAHRILYLAKTHARLGEYEDAAKRAVEGIALMNDPTDLQERLQESIALLAECTRLPEDFPPELTALVRGSQALIAKRRGDAHRELHSVVSNADASPTAIATAHTLLGELWRAKKTT